MNKFYKIFICNLLIFSVIFNKMLILKYRQLMQDYIILQDHLSGKILYEEDADG